MNEEKKQLTKEEKAQEFFSKYQALCTEYGYRLVSIPTFVTRDDGTFSIVIQTNVSEIPDGDGLPYKLK